MKRNVKTWPMLAATVALGFSSLAAQAVPWCYRGTIVTIANANWSQAQIMANFTGSVPSGVLDPEVYITSTSTAAYASTFAGGGGGFGGYSVPGSGQVRVTHLGPYTLTNMVGPGYYYTSQGVTFKLDKCYTFPPLIRAERLEKLEFPEQGVNFEPLEGTEGATKYWLQPKTETDDGRSK